MSTSAASFARFAIRQQRTHSIFFAMICPQIENFLFLFPRLSFEKV